MVRSSNDFHAAGEDIGHPRYCAPEMETFKRYLMFQAMMFVFGIVGPIFLIMFFASQPDPTVKWAYWWGLFITAADILIALVLTAGTSETPTKKRGGNTKRSQSGRSDTSGHSSSSSSSDPFLGGAVGFFSSGSSSDSGWFSGDSGSSSSESWSSSDSGSSSSDSGSSSSSD